MNSFWETIQNTVIVSTGVPRLCSDGRPILWIFTLLVTWEKKVELKEDVREIKTRQSIKFCFICWYIYNSNNNKHSQSKTNLEYVGKIFTVKGKVNLLWKHHNGGLEVR